MDHASLRRAIAAGLALAAFAAPLPGSTQPAQDTVVSDLVVVAPSIGPAWWKVSKGDASVWILGLQPTTPRGLVWDQSTLKRRLKGARLLLGVRDEWARMDPCAKPPPLPADLADEYATLSVRLHARGFRRPAGGGPGPNGPSGAVMGQGLDRALTTSGPASGAPVCARRPMRGPPDVADLWRLRISYAIDLKLDYEVMRDIEALAKKADVPVVTPPVYAFSWEPAALSPDNPAAGPCLRKLVTELNTPPERHREAAALWAKGDVRGLLEVAPPTIEPECDYLWPGYDERKIAFQTSLIAQALDRPGKVVAVALVRHLVARDGILERLRAQGFTIADPSKPLEE